MDLFDVVSPIVDGVEEVKTGISDGIADVKENITSGVSNVANTVGDVFKLDKEELTSRISEIKRCNESINFLVTNFNNSMTDLFDSGFFSTSSSQKTYESFKSSYDYAVKLNETINQYVEMLSSKVLASAETVDTYLEKEASSFENLIF